MSKDNSSFKKYKSKFKNRCWLEVLITLKCSLNCRCCYHGCNRDIISHSDLPLVYDIEQYRSDLEHLSKTTDIEELHLSGGEIFELPNALEYIKIARELFPNTRIGVLSNGIKLTEQNIIDIQPYIDFLLVTHYYKFLKKYAIIRLWCLKHNLCLQYYNDIKFGDIKKTFIKPIMLREPKYDKNKAYLDCDCTITTLYCGKIRPCSIMVSLSARNNLFSTNYQDDTIDVRDIKSNDDLLYPKFTKNVCAYCSIFQEPQKIKWETCKSIDFTDYVQ